MTAEELSRFLSERVARLWLPERWSIIDTIPKTSVDISTRELRARSAEGGLVVQKVTRAKR